MRFDFRPERVLVVDHLRLRRLWLGLGLLLVAGVIVGSLVNLPPGSPFMLHDKLLHLSVYAALMTWFAQIFRHDLARLAFGLGLVALGIGLEFLQGLVPSRQLDVFDMLANSSGVLLAWALSYTPVGNALVTVERLLLPPLSRA